MLPPLPELHAVDSHRKSTCLFGPPLVFVCPSILAIAHKTLNASMSCFSFLRHRVLAVQEGLNHWSKWVLTAFVAFVSSSSTSYLPFGPRSKGELHHIKDTTKAVKIPTPPIMPKSTIHTTQYREETRIKFQRPK